MLKEKRGKGARREARDGESSVSRARIGAKLGLSAGQIKTVITRRMVR